MDLTKLIWEARNIMVDVVEAPFETVGALSLALVGVEWERMYALIRELADQQVPKRDSNE